MASHKKVSLKKNMILHLNGDLSAGVFSEILLKIGDGVYPEAEEIFIFLKKLAKVVFTLTDLRLKIYPDISN